MGSNNVAVKWSLLADLALFLLCMQRCIIHLAAEGYECRSLHIWVLTSSDIYSTKVTDIARVANVTGSWQMW